MTDLPRERTGEAPAARGRHAPPLEVRLPMQRDRLLRAAAADFAEHGYANTGSESISRRAGMSKATFYEHFTNKEDCISQLFDRAVEVLSERMGQAAREGAQNPRDRMRAGTRAFLAAVAEHPDYARTLLVEIIAAGPGPAARRDQVLQTFAAVLERAAAAARPGHDHHAESPLDALAVVGGITELVSRQVRLGEPSTPLDLAPVIDRLIDGMLLAGR